MRLAFKRGWWGAVLPGQVPKLTLQVGPVQLPYGEIATWQNLSSVGNPIDNNNK
jgi:hypothetical protein